MSASMIQAQASSSLKMQKQGIVSILGSEQSERNRASPNPNSLRLRRTLSADMSSKKWVSQNGFTPMKRIASSEDLSPIPHPSFEEERNEERAQSDIWTSIQRDKNKDQQGCFDIWSCIVSNKSSPSPSSVLPTYVHPLVKRSQSSLSDKSLEICTESLGSETGSDVVSSYPQSETEEEEVRVEANEAEKEVEEKKKEEEEEEGYTNNTSSYGKKFSSARFSSSSYSSSPSSSSSSFPPPLPSLSRQDGPSLHMRSRRDHGRLVLDAVSLPSQNNFCAQRQDGRLVLTFANQEEEETEEEEDETEEAEKTEETEEVKRIVTSSSSSSGITSVALMMKNKPNWSEKLNQVVDVDVNVVKRPRVARLISSSPSMASATSFNVYEYYWRTKPTSGGGNTTTTKARISSSSSSSSSSLTLQQSYNNNNGGCSSSKVIVSGGMKNPQQVVVLRGKNGEYLVHNLKTCKDSRRSFLFLEPYCIATS